MKRFFGLLALVALLAACDDGDVITSELIFEGDLTRCDSFVDEFLIYDLNENPYEAINLILPRNAATEAMFVTEISEENALPFTINGTSNRLIYRRYNTEPNLCAIIDNGSVVISDKEATSGTVFVSTSLEDFDDDGIPSLDEDLNGNGDLTDDDTDGDGIPNYLDQDDDDDNVLTADEDDNADGDNNPFTNPRNTDGDDKPDYLDNDDDGDGVLTIQEDENGDQNLFNDFDPETENFNTPRFLNFDANATFEGAPNIFNEYTRVYTTKFVIDAVDLGVIKYESANFGTYETTIIISNQDD